MRDPVCNMIVGVGALTVESHPEFGFCSEHCRRAFLAAPDSYVPADAGNTPQPALIDAAGTPGCSCDCSH